MEHSKFEDLNKKNEDAKPEVDEVENPFGLSEKELEDLYSGNDNSDMYKK